MKYAILVDATITGNALAYECVTRGLKCIHIYSSIESYQKNFNTHTTKFYELGFIYESDDKLLATLSNLDIVLCTAGSDYGVVLAEHITTLLGLPHANTSSTLKFDRYQLQAAMGESCTDVDFSKFLKHHKKCIIKPKRSYGGYDRVRIVHDGDKVEDSPEMYITPFHHGAEYSVDFVSCQGKHKIVAVWQYVKDKQNPFWRERTHLLHYDTHKHIIDPIYEYMIRLLSVIEYNNGASHSEVILTDAGVKLVEVNLRTHGHMDYSGTELALGRNHTQLTIDALLGSISAGTGPEYKTHAFITRVNFFNTVVRPYDSIKWDEISKLQSHSTSYIHYTPHQIIPVSEFNMRSIPAKIVFVNKNPEQLEKDTFRALEIFNE